MIGPFSALHPQGKKGLQRAEEVIPKFGGRLLKLVSLHFVFQLIQDAETPQTRRKRIEALRLSLI